MALNGGGEPTNIRNGNFGCSCTVANCQVCRCNRRGRWVWVPDTGYWYPPFPNYTPIWQVEYPPSITYTCSSTNGS